MHIDVKNGPSIHQTLKDIFAVPVPHSHIINAHLNWNLDDAGMPYTYIYAHEVTKDFSKGL